MFIFIYQHSVTLEYSQTNIYCSNYRVAWDEFRINHPEDLYSVVCVFESPPTAFGNGGCQVVYLQ